MKQSHIQRMSNAEISGFCAQMSLILKAGISAAEGIELLIEEAESQGERTLLKAIRKKLEESGSLADSLQETGAFPAYLLQMIRIGEETGKLDVVFDALSAHYDREAAISQSIRNAVTFPLIMVVMMVLVILLLVTKIMPIFNQVFRQLGSEMTGIAKVILDFGQSISRYSAVLILVLAVLIVLLLFFARTRSGRRLFLRAAARLPFLRRMTDRIAAGRFASGMYLTLSSGMSPEECLDLAARLTDNDLFRRKIDRCREKLNEGESLSAALLHAGIFTGLYAKMTSIGARTGSIDEVMNTIADKYSEEIDQRFTNVVSSLEPTLVIILSLTVGMILLSVMLPLMSILSSI